MPDRIWMDSGAFSAFTLGSKIDLDVYTRWCARWRESMDHYAVLDVIGSPEGTYKNQKRMEELGTAPVPCYHYGEDPSWLRRYLDEGYTYIALGGMVPIETDQLRHWLDDLWGSYLTNDRGEPLVRVHGFGLTTAELVSRYPWFSVDSSSWFATGASGTVIFFMNGQLFRVCVSENSPKAAQHGQHISTFPRAARAAIEEHLSRVYGKTLQEVSTNYEARHAVNVQMYREAEQVWWKPRPFVPEPSLFSAGPTPVKAPAAQGWPWDRCQIYLAGWVTYAVEDQLWANPIPPRRMYSFHSMGKNAKQWAVAMNHIERNKHR